MTTLKIFAQILTRILVNKLWNLLHEAERGYILYLNIIGTPNLPYHLDGMIFDEFNMALYLGLDYFYKYSLNKE